MDASVLSTLAGARGGTVGTTLRRHKQRIRTPDHQQIKPSEKRRAPYLEEEKARFLFLEASADEAGAAGAPAVAPPDGAAARAGTPAPRAGAPDAAPPEGAAARAGTLAPRAGTLVVAPPDDGAARAGTLALRAGALAPRAGTLDARTSNRADN
jgi:hypothetical protein